MPISTVNVEEFVCDGCGNKQYGKLNENVFGVIINFKWYKKDRGMKPFHAYACSHYCVNKAMRHVAGDDYSD